MLNKIEKAPPAPTKEERTIWHFANAIAVSGVIGAILTGVLYPLKTLITRDLVDTTLPPLHNNLAFLTFFRVLYPGALANFSISTVRGVAPQSANSSAEKVVAENTIRMKEVVIATSVDMLLAGHEGYTHLKRANKLPPNFAHLSLTQPSIFLANPYLSLYNHTQLSLNGFTARYSSGLINFICILPLENWIASKLTIKEETKKHFLAGCGAGAVSALMTYPFNLFRDSILLKAKVASDGKLIPQKSLNFLEKLRQQFHEDPKEALRAIFITTGKQLPKRVVLNSASFGLISCIPEWLGSKPLKSLEKNYYASKSRIAFFSQKAAQNHPIDVAPAHQNPFC